MAFDLIIKGSDAQAITKSLYQLLDEVTDREVLKIDQEFYLAHDKHAFLAQFESIRQDVVPQKDPILLERWTHYRWLRLELLYLANQRAILNQFDPNLPQVDTINRAILEAKEAGTSLVQSIDVLRKIKLQIVSTEHPTDPLSQFARDILTKIANAMESESSDPAMIIRNLLHDLQKSDSIPRFQRDVMEEVNRNINTLEKLYDVVPNFVKSVLAAYKTHYQETFPQYEETLWQTLESGMILDASWAGFDADGNENVTPKAMSMAIGLHRIRAAEKHISSLNSTLIPACKRIEHSLRHELFSLNERLFTAVLAVTADKETLQWVHNFQNKTAQFLDLRCFEDLIAHYKSFGKGKAQLPESVLELFRRQVEVAQKLQGLTAFSGSFRTSDAPGLKKGALQIFQKKFRSYLDTIRTNTNELEIQDGEDFLYPTDYFIKNYNELLAKYQHILNAYSELKTSARIFSVQLRSFGLTYGAGHIRQDSSVFVKFWSAVFDDLRQNSAYQGFAIFTLLKDSNYEKLELQERMQVQKLLLNGSEESRTLLKAIYDKHNNSTYLKGAVYQTPHFACVRRELERFELASRHKDMFENVIISNCESAANIFEVEAILRIFPNRNTKLRVVPLLEKRQDLENYEIILLEYLKFIIQEGLKQVIPEFARMTTRAELRDFIAANRKLHAALKNIEFEVMVGFSDTERVSGLTALISIQKVKENILLLAKDLGIQVKFYHGPGGDANRGGLARRDEKGTLQGNARSNLLTTPQSTLRYREAQFYRAYYEKANPLKRIELAAKPPHIQKGIEICQREGIAFYEFLHDPDNGLGKLFGSFIGHGPHWLVSILNLSSRASQRGVSEDQGDRAASVQKGGVRPSLFADLNKLRAITATQSKELLRDNTHLLIGPGRGLRSIDKFYAERLLDSSETMRDLFLKAVLGSSFADYSITAHALFAEYPHLRPINAQQRKEWAQECYTYPERLKKMSIPELLLDKDALLIMLSRLFALLEEEAEQTKIVLAELMKALHFAKGSSTGKLPVYPEWQAYTRDAIREVEPLSLILARQNHHIVRSRNLDEVYPGLNQHPCPGSKLSGVNRLLGNIGAGITAFRIMPPPFCEINYRDDLRPGVTRAEQEALTLGRGLASGPTRNLKLFDPKTTTVLEDMLKKKLQGSDGPSHTVKP